jgi:hypothetical protein
MVAARTANDQRSFPESGGVMVTHLYMGRTYCHFSQDTKSLRRNLRFINGLAERKDSARVGVLQI